MKKLYSIGETSKINSVSIQALRLYEKMGILKPAYINPTSGYRYYKEEQFIWIDIIKYCNYVKLPLKTLKNIFNNKDSKQIKELLLNHKEQIKNEIDYLTRVNNDINNLLKSMDDIKNQNLLNVYISPLDRISIRTKKVDNNQNYHYLDQKMREVEMNMAKQHIGYGSYSGVIYDKKFNPKEVFISYEDSLINDKEITKGNYLTITFTQDDMDKARKILLKYIKDNKIKIDGDFILIQQVGLSIYYIFNYIVKLK